MIELMDTSRLKLYIDGQWRDAASGSTIEVRNPATEDLVCRVTYGGAGEATAAVEAAAAAFPVWSGLSAWERSRFLRRVSDIIRERKEEYARWMTLEMGKPIAESRAEVNATADYFEWFSEEAKRVYGDIVPAHTTKKRHWVIRQPLGVAVAITPWNFPSVLPARKISAALAAGCTIVVRPATQTPLSTLAIVQACEDAGLPKGTVNLVLGRSADLGPVLIGHASVRKVSLTGSVEVGRIIARDAGSHLKKVSLELGGSAPILIFADADLEKAARQTARVKFRNMGQVCIAITRIYVQNHSPGVRRSSSRGRNCASATAEETTELGPWRTGWPAKARNRRRRRRQGRAPGLRRRAPRRVRARLLLPAHGAVRRARIGARAARGTVRAHRSHLRIPRLRRRHRQGQQHQLRAGRLPVHRQPDHRDSGRRETRVRHRGRQRSGRRHHAVPLRRHQGQRLRARRGASGDR
jgi:hypothetical protein